MNVAIPLVIVCMILNTIAQLLLKQAMNTIGAFAFAWKDIIPLGFKVATSPYIILGIICYVLSLVLWLGVLSRMEVSIAYPLTSIAFILTAIGAAIFFGEHVTMIRVAGIVVIITGIYLISK